MRRTLEAGARETGERKLESMKTISVCSNKGGTGKTTTVSALAALLADRGKRVLAVDLDPQANLTDEYREGPGDGEPTVNEVLVGTATAADAVVDVLGQGPGGEPRASVSLLPSSSALANVEIELRDQRLAAPLKLARVLSGLEDSYDICLVDCSASVGTLTDMAFIASDWVLVPCDMGFWSVSGAARLGEEAAAVNAFAPGRPVSFLGVLRTMYDPRHRCCKDMDETVADLASSLSCPVFDSWIRRGVRVQEAHDMGWPVTVYDPKCGPSRDYSALADEVLERTGE